jgi:amino acid adenylation domain-containing protein
MQTIDLSKTRAISHNPFEQGEVLVAVPTTESQREIWSTLQLEENATLCYNESIAIEFFEGVDALKLNIAFQEVLKRHDSLRSSFSIDGKFFFVGEYKNNPILKVNVRSTEELEAIKKNEVLLKFDLIQGPCIRGTLVNCENGTSVLIITAHHIVCDGWSFSVILNELNLIYIALLKNQSFHIQKANQFSEFALGKTDLNHRNYWLKEFFHPPETLKIPLDFERPHYRTYDSKRFDLTISKETVNALKKIASKEKYSFYNVLMTSFNLFIHKLTNADDIVIGMASAAQSTSMKWDLVGHLVNLLPLRTFIRNEESFLDHLKTSKSKILEAFDHTEFSFGSLVKELPIKRSSSEIPLLNIVFNIDQQDVSQKFQFSTIPRNFENFEIFVNMVSCGENLSLECQFNQNLWRYETIEKWFSSYIELLNILTLQPQMAIKDFSVSIFRPTISETIIAKEDIVVRHPENEERILKIWKDVLKLEKIGREDNFFSLGGHSLLAIEIINRIKNDFACDFAVKEIFLTPTITQLASKLASPLNEDPQTVNIPRLNLTKTDASYSQVQAWYLEEMNQGTGMHNLPSSIRIKSKIDLEALEKALHALIDRHAAFKTAIVVEKGVPTQVIHDSLNKPKLTLEKVSQFDIQKILNVEANYVFDIKAAPLYRAKLFQLADDDFVFFFMVHHSIWDGWSFDIFFEELNIAYSAYLKKEIPHYQADPEVTYFDFSKWQRDSLENGQFDQEIKFWRENLCVPLPVLELPTDYKRPVNLSHDGKTFAFTIPGELDQKLRQFARSNSTSLFNLLLTAFKVTLARYSGQTDVIVGSPTRNRPAPELLNTIGYFVNSVALRTHINFSDSFKENLVKVGQTCINAFANQSVPFQVILNKIEYSKDSTRTPVFQTFFSYQDVSNRGGRLGGTPYSQINVDKASTHTDLDLWIKTSHSKIEGAFEYRPDLFRDITIERFKETFFQLLESLNECSTGPMNQVLDLPNKQKELILQTWNNTDIDYSHSLPFHKYFEQNVLLQEHAIALETEEGTSTYKNLNKAANKIAHSLRERGIGPKDLVGISIHRQKGLVETILGVLKSGAGYVPLDPSFPQDRLDYMIGSSSPKILITEKSLRPRFSQNNVIELTELACHQDDSNPNIIQSMSDPMYVIYTSGSTGKPKGVQISLGAMTNFLLSMKKAPGFRTQDKILAVTTFSFDIAALELYLPLLTGGQVYLASQYDVLDGEALKKIIYSRGITQMQATPSTWRLLQAANWTPKSNFKVLCGGEPFPADLAKWLLDQGAEVWNMYGPTETTVWSTCKQVTVEDSLITVGKPIDNTYVYILNEEKKLVPPGAAGELYIAGMGLADGYFGRSDLTAERFISNPFRTNEMMYATGDFARFTHNGEIECLGRRDGQVKIRGYRIELGEIELCLSKIAGVVEASVITMEVQSKDTRILAFIRSHIALDDREFRMHLERNLPRYMIPSHFIMVKDFPKTLNGKIDKKALPALFKPEQDLKRETQDFHTAPSSLKQIWSQVLGTNNFSETESFFDIGGNSLLAVQLFSKIATDLQIELPLSTLFEASSFQKFSSMIERQIIPTPAQLPDLFKSLVMIKKSGLKKPLFCFHGVGGNVLNYMALAPYVEERPLIALQSLGLDGTTQLPHTVEEMASYYIREMRIVQPKGPYLLAGGSMGGMIAMEVAHQLQAMGQTIDKIIMFDTFGPDINIKTYDKSERSFWKNLKVSFYYRFRTFSNRIRISILNFLGLPIPLEIRLFDVEMNNYRALWKYRPKPYHGVLHIIRGKMKEQGWYSDESMGWGKTILGNIHSFEIEGSHHDFVESAGLGPVLKKLM